MKCPACSSNVHTTVTSEGVILCWSHVCPACSWNTTSKELINIQSKYGAVYVSSDPVYVGKLEVEDEWPLYAQSAKVPSP